MQKVTYLQNSLNKGVLIRWPDHCFPLKFYIAPFKWYASKGDDYKYRQMVIDALNLWQSATSGQVSFEIVNVLHESQINLDWRRVDRKSLGHCNYNFDNQGRLYSAEVQIGLSDGVLHSRYMDGNEVMHTIIHEIGHALGLGHSPNKSDIMYTPHQYGVTSISQADVMSLIWLYRLPWGTPPNEIAAKYGIASSDIDDVIAKLTNEKHKSEFEKVKDNIKVEEKNLLEEQARIAELKKYTVLALQDVKLPKDVYNYIKKPPLK